jgi:hypothetical protein
MGPLSPRPRFFLGVVMSETPVTPKPVKTPKKSRRQLTYAQRIEASTAWALGTVTIKDLAKRFGKSELAIQRALKKMGVEKGSQRAIVDAQVADQLKKEAEAQATEIAKKVRETNDETYRMLSAYQKLSAQSVTEARHSGARIGTTINDAKALELHIRAVRMAHEGRLKALGVKDDSNGEKEEMPVLGIQEMTAEDIALERARLAEEDTESVGALEDLVATGEGGEPASNDKVAEGDDDDSPPVQTPAK